MTHETRQRIERLIEGLEHPAPNGMVIMPADVKALRALLAAAEAGELMAQERDEARRFIERWFAARNLPAPEISSLVLGQLEQIEACYPYLKGGETPVECIERHRKDIDALMTLMGQDKTELARLRPLAEAGERLKAIVQRFIDSPYGCRFCDSGQLRNPLNPAKGHDDDCPWLMARWPKLPADPGPAKEPQ